MLESQCSHDTVCVYQVVGYLLGGEILTIIYIMQVIDM